MFLGRIGEVLIISDLDDLDYVSSGFLNITLRRLTKLIDLWPKY